MFGQLRATDETKALVDNKVVLGGRCYYSIYNELELLNPHVAEKQFLNECACSQLLTLSVSHGYAYNHTFVVDIVPSVQLKSQHTSSEPLFNPTLIKVCHPRL
jgi:hypothetical protein